MAINNDNDASHEFYIDDTNDIEPNLIPFVGNNTDALFYDGDTRETTNKISESNSLVFTHLF